MNLDILKKGVEIQMAASTFDRAVIMKALDYLAVNFLEKVRGGSSETIERTITNIMDETGTWAEAMVIVNHIHHLQANFINANKKRWEKDVDYKAVNPKQMTATIVFVAKILQEFKRLEVGK